MTLKPIFAAALAVLFVTSEAQAYSMTIANRTGVDIVVDVYQVAKTMGGRAFDGINVPWERSKEKKIKKQDGVEKVEDSSSFRLRNAGTNTTIYNFANMLEGPQVVSKNESAFFRFAGGQAGLCFKLDSLNVGIAGEGGHGVGPIKIYTMDTNTWEIILPAIKEFGDDVKEVVEAVGEAVEKANPAAGKATKKAGSLTKMFNSIGKLVAKSACKNMTIMIVKDEDGSLIGFTKDELMSKL